jgi:hypothetical protein
MQRELSLDPTWQQYVPLAGEQMQQGADLIGAAGQQGLAAMQGRTPFNQAQYDAMYQGVYDPVVQDMQAEANRVGLQQFQDTTLADLNRNFTGTGGWGGSRDQILSADAAARAQAEIEGRKAAVAMQGRTNAAQDYLNWSKQGLSGANQLGQTGGQNLAAGQNWMNFGQQQQAAQATDIQSLMGLGQMQQQADQQNLDLAYQQFQQQQNYPWEQYGKWYSATKGQTIPFTDMSSSSSSSSGLNVGFPGAPQQSYTNPWSSALQGGLGAASSIWSAFK